MNYHPDDQDGDRPGTDGDRHVLHVSGGLWSLALMVSLMMLGVWKLGELLGAALYAATGS
jgi:hypothetical protein